MPWSGAKRTTNRFFFLEKLSIRAACARTTESYHKSLSAYLSYFLWSSTWPSLIISANNLATPLGSKKNFPSRAVMLKVRMANLRSKLHASLKIGRKRKRQILAAIALRLQNYANNDNNPRRRGTKGKHTFALLALSSELYTLAMVY